MLTEQNKVGTVIKGVLEMTFEPDSNKVRNVDWFRRAEIILIWGSDGVRIGINWKKSEEIVTKEGNRSGRLNKFFSEIDESGKLKKCPTLTFDIFE